MHVDKQEWMCGKLVPIVHVLVDGNFVACLSAFIHLKFECGGGKWAKL